MKKVSVSIDVRLKTHVFVYKSEENRKQNQTDNKLFFINS